MASDPTETTARGSSGSRSAAVRGAIQDRPVPRLLHELFRKQLTGCLTIVDDSGDQSRLFLREGAPVHIERPNDIDRLDQVLIDAGLLAPEVIRGFSATLPPGRRLGETLIEHGLITSRALADALKLQMRRKLLRLFFPRKGEFAVYVEAHPFGNGGEYGEMRVDPRCLIYPGIRASYDEHRLEAELAPLKNHRFRLLPTLPESMLEPMGFQAQDVTLRALADRALALHELPVSGAKLIDSLSVVLALLYTDLLETTPLAAVARNTEAAAPPEAPAPAPVPAPAPATARPAPVSPPTREPTQLPTPPRHSTTATYPMVGGGLGSGAAPASTARQTATMPAVSSGAAVSRQTSSHPAIASPPATADWATVTAGTAGQANLGGQISELSDKLSTLSHFQLLGIPENASLAELGAAYLRNVRLYHPDRLPGLGLGHLTEKAARIVAQLNEAQVVLGDPKRRSEYLAARARPASAGPVIDSGQSIVAAERSFQTGEQLLRKGDFPRAAEAFTEAMKANPLEPIYKAYWAWARWDNPGPHKDRLVRETLKILDETMKERQKFPQGLYWIGLLHKHLGDLTAAANAFRAAVNQDKNMLDAERELRVIELRRTRATAAHAVQDKPATTTAARQKDGVLNKFLKR